jgi:WD40 repeat protein
MMIDPLLQLSPDNPWPGLGSFGESDAAYFHGRSKETADLLRLVKRELLTLVFGRSGLGKTSLLRAGLFPVLRKEGFLPVYVRLDCSGGGPPLRMQILSAVLAECQSRQIEAPRPADWETLWEFFHRRDVEFWNSKNRPLTPLIVLDQFEEAFRKGYQDEVAKMMVREFLVELGDLIENRLPSPIKEAFDENPELDLRVDHRKTDFKLILSFREDYLANIEELKRQIPSLTYNRYRLSPMDGYQAEEVVNNSGGHLLEDGVTERIIGIVAGTDQSMQPLHAGDFGDLEIDPALLSVICSELNIRRQMSRLPRITPELTVGAQYQILSDFYERSLSGLDPRVRVFVENELLTDGGYRDSYALDDALGLDGITRQQLDALVASRLLRVDERSGVRRLELTHDVLTQVVKESRDTRMAREAEAAALARERQAARRQRRNWIVSLLLLVGAAFVVGSGVLVANLWRQVDQLNIQTVQRTKSLLVAQAKWFQPMQYDLALLLNVEAYRLARSSKPATALDVQAEFAHMIFSHPHLDGFLDAKDNVLATVFSPDGRSLASAGLDNKVTLWDASSRKAIAVLEGHTDAVLAVAFSPDGKRLASAGKDMTVIVWDLDTRTPVFSPLRGHLDRILGIAFSPDGRTVASASYDGKVILWDAATGGRISTLAGTGVQYLGLAFSPIQPLLAVACADKSVLLLDVETGRQRVRLSGHEDRVLSVAFSPNGKTLASASEDKTVMLWDVQSALPLGLPLRKHEGAVWGVSFSPDGKLLASAGEDMTVVLWVLPPDEGRFDTLESTVLEGHRGVVRSVSFSSDGKTLASGSDDHRLILWDLLEQKLLTRLYARQGPVWGVAFSPNGEMLASATENGEVILWASATGRRLPSVFKQHQGPVLAVSFDPEGKLLASASEDKTVVLWDITRLGVDDTVPGLPLSGHDDAVTNLGFSPDGKLLASASKDGTVMLWDMGKRERIATLRRHQGPVRSVAFSPDGKWLASAGDDKTVVLWDAASRRQQAVLLGHQQRVYAVAFSPDGKLLASGGQEGALFLWNVATHKLHLALAGPPGAVLGLAFSADGRVLATAGPDGSLRLWDVARGGKLTSLGGHRGRVLGVAFSPDNQTIATAGVDGTSILWNWSLDALAELACRVANRNLSCPEWNEYIGATPYRKTCNQMPAPACP